MLKMLMDIILTSVIKWSLMKWYHLTDYIMSMYKIDILGYCFIDNMNMLKKLKGSITRAMN